MVEVGTSAAAPPPSLLSLCLHAVVACLASYSAGRTGWAGGWSSDGHDGLADEGGGEDDEQHLSSEQVAEALPWELLHRLASQLPPAALESLHQAAQTRCYSSADTSAELRGPDSNKHGTKRSRCLDEAAENAMLPSFRGSELEASECPLLCGNLCTGRTADAII
ncbi:hypothetical protein PR202_gb00213 [Eleusine coracana subsp. coracana]|uniref:Uncharacterized protein n=1 Tax=Eleusine coracana subsp. coracana TaxID=191504 RepID=A0AAV5DT31_ELECO|nr:hypothetical protein PR202_gb00213 [Eleusine coracana subsp. coracana]